MPVKLPAVLPKVVATFWYYDASLNCLRSHNSPSEVPPHNNLRWCPQPLIAPEDRGSRCWCLMLHDHARYNAGYFYAFHTGKNGKPLRYTHAEAERRARSLNGDADKQRCSVPTEDFVPVERLIPAKLSELKKLKKPELVKLMEDMVMDFQRLNHVHNNRARERGWCGQYEQNQEHYNTLFKVFKLAGREERYGGNVSGL